jgi:hypothetical protein
VAALPGGAAGAAAGGISGAAADCHGSAGDGGEAARPPGRPRRGLRSPARAKPGAANPFRCSTHASGSIAPAAVKAAGPSPAFASSISIPGRRCFVRPHPRHRRPLRSPIIPPSVPRLCAAVSPPSKGRSKTWPPRPGAMPAGGPSPWRGAGRSFSQSFAPVDRRASARSPAMRSMRS